MDHEAQDERFVVPSREELIAKLDALLATPRVPALGGHWPLVSFDRMHEMDEFFQEVRKAVMEPDMDGHMVITWSMLHRANHRAPGDWVRAPIRIETEEQVQEATAAAASLISAGAELLRVAEFQMRANMRAAQKKAAGEQSGSVKF